IGTGEPCRINPACLQSDNLISVVAVDDDLDNPKVIPRSPSGQVFHIAAPGMKVMSAVAGHQKGTLSGTSQATAVVSGAASLLLSVDSKMRPIDIKKRLIYTSDFLPSLKGKMFGGRLNIKRSLTIEDDIMTFINSEGELETLYGRLLTEKANGQNKGIERDLAFFDNTSRKKENIQISTIARLVRSGRDRLKNDINNQHEYTIITALDRKGKPVSLRKRVGILLHKKKTMVEFVDLSDNGGNSRFVKVSLVDIVDFTSKLRSGQ
ncbi:MAG: S8 family serine peptidase, partial [Bacteroidia bacterium]|nr:S8 family serine peptidase [Bacteroidia bacterium]